MYDSGGVEAHGLKLGVILSIDVTRNEIDLIIQHSTDSNACKITNAFLNSASMLTILICEKIIIKTEKPSLITTERYFGQFLTIQ